MYLTSHVHGIVSGGQLPILYRRLIRKRHEGNRRQMNLRRADWTSIVEQWTLHERKDWQMNVHRADRTSIVESGRIMRGWIGSR